MSEKFLKKKKGNKVRKQHVVDGIIYDGINSSSQIWWLLKGNLHNDSLFCDSSSSFRCRSTWMMVLCVVAVFSLLFWFVSCLLFLVIK